MAVPMDPTWGLLSPVPLFCPPPKQIFGYAPAGFNDDCALQMINLYDVYCVSDLAAVMLVGVLYL